MADKNPVDVLYSTEQIRERVAQLGEQISRDYEGKDLFVICILNGAFIFCADLLREVKAPLQVEFMAAKSYQGTDSTGEVKIVLDLKHPIKNRDVLIVEDIVDTGLTLKNLMRMLAVRGPRSLKLASLLHKPERTEHPVPIDYLGFEIEDKFVVGYGLDYDGRYRELPYIGVYRGDD